jgi:sugar phosphate isomerase/epimerase
MKESLRKSGVGLSSFSVSPDLRSTGGTYYLAPPDSFQRSLAHIKRLIETASSLGAEVINLANPVWAASRFRVKMPIDKQIERYAENVKRVMEITDSFNFRSVSIENNGDYQIPEIIRIVELVGSDKLRIDLNTGNPLLVWEDPVDAAKQAAPHVIATHFRDNYIHALTWYGFRIFGTRMGKGQVNLQKILEILSDGSPVGKNLSLCLEVMTPEGDEDRMVEESLRYVRENFGEYIT